MENSEVPQGWRKRSVVLAGVVAVAALAVVLAGPTGTASAAKMVGKDGRIYACYRVGGGKSKGTVRLVHRRMHCRRGERKLSWSVQGPPGPAGAAGKPGKDGQEGSSNSTVEAKLTELNDRLKTLEGVLSGVTNAQLKEAIAAVADVNALCTQATALTNQVNALGGALEGLGLGGIVPVGLELLVPSLPAALPSFSCP